MSVKTAGPEPSHMGPTLSRAHFNSASTLRGSVRDNSLDVITEEQELLITQLPDTSYSAPPRLRHVSWLLASWVLMSCQRHRVTSGRNDVWEN